VTRLLLIAALAACSSTPETERVLVDADFSDANTCDLALDGTACSSADCVSIIGTVTCTCETTWACSSCPGEFMQPTATCAMGASCAYHAVHAGADARCTCTCSAAGTWTCTNTAGTDCPTGT
jgi:hypothetical protein